MSYEYLSALLNASYLRYLYTKSVQEGGRVFPQVKLEKLKPLPIKIISVEKQQPFIDLYKEIEAAKQQGQPTTTQETQIDNMVYALYNLTPQEIAVVEGK